MKWEFAITIAYIIDVYRPMRVGTRVEKKQRKSTEQVARLTDFHWPNQTENGI